MIKISIVVPCYNEEGNILLLYDSIISVIKKMKVKYELLFIDDGSSDSTLKKIKDLAKKDKNLVYYSFSRNFGKEAAIYCGLLNSTGDYVVIMDADLQHPTELINDMYNSIKEREIDTVYAIREKKIKKSIVVNVYSKIMSCLSGMNFINGLTDYRMMNRKMVNAILELSERKRFSKAIFYWVGFKSDYVLYDDIDRKVGNSKWSFIKLFKYAIDGIISFSDKLLYLPFVLFILLFICFIIFLILSFKYKQLFIYMFLSFLFSLLFMVIGIMSLYISNIHYEVKKRPIFVLSESNKKQ